MQKNHVNGIMSGVGIIKPQAAALPLSVNVNEFLYH